MLRLFLGVSAPPFCVHPGMLCVLLQRKTVGPREQGPCALGTKSCSKGSGPSLGTCHKVWGCVAVTTGELLAWGGWRPGMLLSALQGPGHPAEKDPPSVHGAQGRKLLQMWAWVSCSVHSHRPCWLNLPPPSSLPPSPCVCQSQALGPSREEPPPWSFWPSRRTVESKK
jgi:hypothetical protein